MNRVLQTTVTCNTKPFICRCGSSENIVDYTDLDFVDVDLALESTLLLDFLFTSSSVRQSIQNNCDMQFQSFILCGSSENIVDCTDLDFVDVDLPLDSTLLLVSFMTSPTVMYAGYTNNCDM